MRWTFVEGFVNVVSKMDEGVTCTMPWSTSIFTIQLVLLSALYGEVIKSYRYKINYFTEFWFLKLLQQMWLKPMFFLQSPPSAKASPGRLHAGV